MSYFQSDIYFTTIFVYLDNVFLFTLLKKTASIIVQIDSRKKLIIFVFVKFLVFSIALHIHYEGAKKAIEKMGLEKERQFFPFHIFQNFPRSNFNKTKNQF